MFISPIEFGSIIGGQKSVAAPQNDMSFFNEFQNAINDARQAEKQAAEDAYKLAIGEADNLHEITINAAKAELSVQLVVQLRNKLLDSYSEIMRMGI